MGNIKISVIIPLFNEEKHISECINSIITQTLDGIEIICIDDESVDSTIQILETYTKIHKNFHLIKQKHGGVGSARNKGIETAKGEFLAFMDADDFYPDCNVLEILYDKAIENNLPLCGGGLDHIFTDGMIGKDPFKLNKIYNKEGKYKYHNMDFESGWQRYIYNRKFIINNGIRFKNYKVGEDSLFLLTVLAIADEYYYIPKVVYNYRVGERKLKRKVDYIDSFLNMIRDSLDISSQYKLKRQHAYFVKCFQHDNYVPICFALEKGKDDIEYLVRDIYKHIDEKLINDINCRVLPQLYEASEREKFIKLCINNHKELLDNQNKYEKIIIYGAGKIGRELYLFLEKNKLKEKVIIAVTNKEYQNFMIDNIEIREIDELLEFKNSSIVLIAAMEDVQKEMEKNLKALNFDYLKTLNQKVIGMWGLWS